MDQKTSFQERLARINAGVPADAARPVPGREESQSHSRLQRRSDPSPALELVMVPLAFCVGLGSVVFGKWVQFHYLTDQGAFGLDAGDMAGGFLGDIIIAIVVSLILKEIMNLKTPVRSWSEIAGFVTGLFSLATIVELFPDAFAALFSPEWVLASLYAADYAY